MEVQIPREMEFQKDKLLQGVQQYEALNRTDFTRLDSAFVLVKLTDLHRLSTSNKKEVIPHVSNSPIASCATRLMGIVIAYSPDSDVFDILLCYQEGVTEVSIA